jgi:hypothetical protein
MNKRVIHFYQESSGEDPASGHFHKVIALHHAPSLEWEMLIQKIPTLPRGWYELSKLTPAYRIEFVRDYWITKLPFQPKFNEFLISFFDHLEDIGVYLTQQTFDDPFEAHLVYTQKGDGGFFHGSPPLVEDIQVKLNRDFPDFLFPPDYIAFLQIHDGFSKYTDTGLIKSSDLLGVYQPFQTYLGAKDALLNGQKEVILGT